MRALVRETYGDPSVLRVADVAERALGAGEVRVAARASGLNKADWHLLTGRPYLMRAVFGFSRPKQPILGMAVAGEVVEVASPDLRSGDPGDVTPLRVGDRVVAEVGGAFAERVIGPSSAFVRIPEGVPFEDAACLPVAGTTAVQGWRLAGDPGAERRVLVIGAAGGVGGYAVQRAARAGATVSAVCGASGADLARAQGATEVFDHRAVAPSGWGEGYDAVFDLAGRASLAELRARVRDGGVVIGGAGGDGDWLGPVPTMLGGLLGNLLSKRRYAPLAAVADAPDLALLVAELAAGRLRAPITARYRPEEAAAGLAALGAGHFHGKGVIRWD